jgi:hypothetical protein
MYAFILLHTSSRFQLATNHFSNCEKTSVLNGFSSITSQINRKKYFRTKQNFQVTCFRVNWVYLPYFIWGTMGKKITYVTEDCEETR